MRYSRNLLLLVLTTFSLGFMQLAQADIFYVQGNNCNVGPRNIISVSDGSAPVTITLCAEADGVVIPTAGAYLCMAGGLYGTHFGTTAAGTDISPLLAEPTGLPSVEDDLSGNPGSGKDMSPYAGSTANLLQITFTGPFIDGDTLVIGNGIVLSSSDDCNAFLPNNTTVGNISITVTSNGLTVESIPTFTPWVLVGLLISLSGLALRMRRNKVH